MGLMDSYEENVRAIEELEMLIDCHKDEIVIEILSETLEAIKHNLEQILEEYTEENRKNQNYN